MPGLKLRRSLLLLLVKFEKSLDTALDALHQLLVLVVAEFGGLDLRDVRWNVAIAPRGEVEARRERCHAHGNTPAPIANATKARQPQKTQASALTMHPRRHRPDGRPRR